jgi:hypothetical protein
MQQTPPKEEAMPNGIYPVPVIHRRSGEMALGVRLRTWLRRDLYDERLASGADPAASPELGLRARQLSSQFQRARLASSLEHVVSEAYDRPLGFSTQEPLRRGEVRSCADDLFSLARRLRDDRPINVQGAAMASRLLNDGTGPLNTWPAPFTLRHAVRSARLALDLEPVTETALPIAA